MLTKESIETLWNVNQKNRVFLSILMIESIETLWNVNER